MDDNLRRKLDVLEGVVQMVDLLPKPYPYKAFPALLNLCIHDFGHDIANRLGCSYAAVEQWHKGAFRPSLHMSDRELGRAVEEKVFKAVCDLRNNMLEKHSRTIK